MPYNTPQERKYDMCLKRNNKRNTARKILYNNIYKALQHFIPLVKYIEALFTIHYIPACDVIGQDTIFILTEYAEF